MILSSLKTCILFRIFFFSKRIVFGAIYRSPSQDIFEFENFQLNFEKFLNYTILSNSLFTTIFDDFNTILSAWWTYDKTITEGTQLESLTTVHGFQQLISQPTSSCINLIFSDQPKLIVRSSAHPSFRHEPQSKHNQQGGRGSGGKP